MTTLIGVPEATSSEAWVWRRSWNRILGSGHAHPAFTMHTYQHLLPGVSADAATRFAGLVAAAGR